jgi:ribosomal protein L37AE/L43A
MPPSKNAVKCPACGNVARKRRRAAGYKCSKCHSVFVPLAAGVTAATHMERWGINRVQR